MRALIIEDVAMLAWSAEELLEALGFDTIDLAATSAQAIAAAKLNCPDLIIADSHIAGGSGVAAVKTICADADIPTIFVTGDRRSVLRHLPNAFVLEKPYAEKDFIAAVRRLLPQAQVGRA